ncbi:MAG: hypothetical protein AABX96_00420 [Nanoarchaeota archaeon]
MVRNKYFVVEENALFTSQDGNFAKTSPLLQCVGLFVYDGMQKQGVLAHWASNSIVQPLKSKLDLIRLRNPEAVMVGCGVVAECPFEDSYIPMEVTDFLTKERILIRVERVGLDCATELRVNFLNGTYRVRKVTI